MKKAFFILLAALMLLLSSFAAATGITVEGVYADGTFEGDGPGYLGPMKVQVTVSGGKITDVRVLQSIDTDAMLKTAADKVIPAIIAANSVAGVDVASGATYSSKGILLAGAMALRTAGARITIPEQPAVVEAKPATGVSGMVYHGLGAVPNFRVGPGKDSADAQVYSFNVTMASVLFDDAGRILDMEVDIYEVSTPNYDGASMPHFSGWPDKEGYNVTDHASGQVTGVSENSVEMTTGEVNGWLTKRERGAEYGMNAQNEWYQQMNAYENYFVGKTVAQMREWFTKYTSARNGRPIKATSTNEDDLKALAAMNDADKALLADVVSQATMSLSDAHGLILEAVEKAYANRTAAIELGAGK